MNKNLVSNCCSAPLEIVAGDEGTCFYKCTKCLKPCDPGGGKTHARSGASGSLFGFCVGLSYPNVNLRFRNTCCVCGLDVYYNDHKESIHVIHAECLPKIIDGFSCRHHNDAQAEELCHCGMPLHYVDPKIKSSMRNLVAELGEFITVTCEGKSWKVPRHYIALHGIQGSHLPILGFEEIL